MAMKRACAVFLAIAFAASAFAGDLVIRLRTADGRYVSWAAAPEIELRSVANPTDTETLLLIDEMGGALNHGDIIYLVTPNDGTYLNVDYNTVPRRVRAFVKQAGSWEPFRIERADTATSEIVNGDRILLRNFRDFWNEKLSDLISDPLKSWWIGRDNASSPPRLIGIRSALYARPFTLEVVGPLSRTPPPMLSAPFAAPSLFSLINYTDREYGKGDSTSDCVDFKGGQKCYDGHSGIDLSARGFGFRQLALGGLHVLAAAPGTVVFIDDTNEDRCFGSGVGNVTCPGTTATNNNVISVMQEDGNLAQYVHVKRGSARVQVNQHVNCGDTLAFVGSAGVSANPHVHFEIWQPRFPGDSTFDSSFFQRARVLDAYELNLFTLSNDIPKVTCGDQREKAAGSNRIALEAFFQRGAEFDSCTRFADCGGQLYCGSNSRCTPVRRSGESCDGANPCAFGLLCLNNSCTPPPQPPQPSCSAAFVDANPFQSGTQYVCCGWDWTGKCTKVRYTCDHCPNGGGCIDINKGQGDIDAACH